MCGVEAKLRGLAKPIKLKPFAKMRVPGGNMLRLGLYPILGAHRLFADGAFPT